MYSQQKYEVQRCVYDILTQDTIKNTWAYVCMTFLWEKIQYGICLWEGNWSVRRLGRRPTFYHVSFCALLIWHHINLLSINAKIQISVSVHLCHYKKIHRLDNVQTEIYFSQSGNEKSKIKMPADLVSGEGCSLLPGWYLVAVSSMGEEGCVLIQRRDQREELHILKPFYEDPNPIYEGSTVTT